MKSFTDPRDGQIYKTVELNGLRWMAQNLNYDVGAGSWWHENKPENGAAYGRLYTWEAAQEACPDGWYLPTDEEWREMAKLFGGCDDDAEDGGKAAYKTLIEGGRSGFAAQLSGSYSPSGSFGLLGVGGLYWSATENDTGDAWGYYFGHRSGKLHRVNYNKKWALSCRCIQGYK